MKEEQVKLRKQRGMQIAKTTRIVRTEQGWKVPSQSGSGQYLVVSNGFEATCSCPDYEVRRCKCKHVWAVEFIVTQEVDSEGNMTITQTVHKTYAQQWSEYDRASTNQKRLFLKLLSDVTATIEEPKYCFGRPSLPLRDMAYASIMKVFTTFSLRRFIGDIEIANEKGYIGCKPCYSSVGHFFQSKELTSLLTDMVVLTSLPLRTVEKDFTIDSTGFGTSNFQRWFSFKHGKEITSRKWVKCHFIAGAKTNIVSSVKITTEFDNDCPQLRALVQKTAESFDMEEVSADKAYLSRDNLKVIAELGAIPYIPFKSNSTDKSRGTMLWKRMYYYFMLNNEEFMQHYHKRSNAETTVHMIKSKFGDSVRSKTWTAQVNEALCKVICHNLCVVIQEMHELGIEPLFSQAALKTEAGEMAA